MKKAGEFIFLGFSILILAGAITAYGNWSEPFDVGSLGQWASAFGTVTAVWVALRNTRTTLKATEAREDLRQARNDESYVSAICVLTSQIHQAITFVHRTRGGKKITTKSALVVLRASNLEGLIAALDRVPLHLAPSPVYVGVCDNVRTAGYNVVHILKEHDSDSSERIIDISAEVELIDGARDDLREAATTIGLGELFE